MQFGRSALRRFGRSAEGGRIFPYELCLEDGTEVGEAVDAQYVKIGETIWAAGASRTPSLQPARLRSESRGVVNLDVIGARPGWKHGRGTPKLGS